MAEREAEIDAKATYFVMLSSDFYNPMAEENEMALKRISGLGHEIGLHFDVRKYGDISEEQLCRYIGKEAKILGDIVEKRVTSMSWHRPYKDYYGKCIRGLDEIGIRNAYDKKFVESYKYCSDSMMNWRDDPLDFMDTDVCPKLQILTHPVWYDNVGILMNVEMLKDVYVEKNNRIMEYVDSLVPGTKGYIKFVS